MSWGLKTGSSSVVSCAISDFDVLLNLGPIQPGSLRERAAADMGKQRTAVCFVLKEL
jgi:hypothetical protein